MRVSKHLHNLQVNNVHNENEHLIVGNAVYCAKTKIKISFPQQMRLSNIQITGNGHFISGPVATNLL